MMDNAASLVELMARAIDAEGAARAEKFRAEDRAVYRAHRWLVGEARKGNEAAQYIVMRMHDLYDLEKD
jgi:hypothetical protein